MLYNKIKHISIVICTLISLSSCLKDESLVDWSAMKFVIELPYSNHYLTETLVVPTENVVFDLMVNYTIPDKKDNKEDITVVLAVDESLVKTYNEENLSDYELLPASTYTIPEIVIEKGTQLTSKDFEINTSVLVPGRHYILPVVIRSVPDGYTISGNFGHVYLRIEMA